MTRARWELVGTLICDEVPVKALAAYYDTEDVPSYDPLEILIADEDAVITDFDIFGNADVA